MIKASYYPGCSLDGTAKEFGDSTREAAARLGIELQELPDWTCCGASSAHTTNSKLSVTLPGRDLETADKIGLDVVVPCAACYQRLKAADRYLRAHRNSIKYEGKFRILHVAEFLWEAIGEKGFKSKLKKPLTGLNPVCYYGCLITRPPRVTGSPDPDNPEGIDNIMKALGAGVKDWAFKTECCGGSVMFTSPGIARKMTARIFDMAIEAGADSIVVACPICQSNLDMRQEEISAELQKSYNIPILYVTEMIGLALGSPVAGRWFGGHLADPRPFLKQKGLI